MAGSIKKTMKNIIPQDPKTSGSGLERFIAAQDPVIEQVYKELGAGCKTSHWMWFVFPQLRCLGRSNYAVHFGIENLEEARAYLAHTVLRTRLMHCLEILLNLENRSALEIFGKVDTRKLQSCLTLFEIAEGKNNSVFSQVLDKYYAGERDNCTKDNIQPRNAN
jgi:uncharacterized protein (DUF1810 family)